ncbi:cell wall binding repeat-containing protein [[Clostridium] symbiosum]|uniref:Rib/alpha-like domain-containing protein n=3 Tax=Clostridium symbiosum TaxID=1512 RepID=UPI0006C6EB6F|nr:Rib/alpha-like domain-containing protein [[Clostridium] symbiosum]MEA4844373.1 Rib/alpha-like domain-containing protein [[Clostridium] symbiosum]CUO98352.1 cell wall binding repeat-containing protein [[Clostridium] symbiosum]
MKSSLKQKRRKIKRAGQKACAFALSIAVMVPSIEMPSYAAVSYRNGNGSISERSMDTNSHFTANGIEESDLRYAATIFSKVDGDGTIHLIHSKWTKLGQGWGEDASNPFAGKFILTFSNDQFYKQIDRVTLDDTNLQKMNDGALWMIPVVGNMNVGAIGVVTNHDIKITLKNGHTLESLGLADEEVSFNSLWIKSNGAIAEESVSNGFILQDNSNVKNEKDTDFTRGAMNQKVVFDAGTMSIKSIHSWKPNQNYLQTDYGWVVYVKEKMPVELLRYIDRNEVYIYNSDVKGVKPDARKKFRVTIDDTGMLNTGEVPELSIIGNDTTTQLSSARDNTNDIFWGTLGQSRNYTISYKLRDDVTLAQFAKEMNDYVEAKNARVLFEHWMEADYLNESNQTVIHKPDGGAPPKQLTNSYSNAYLDTNDTDQDGLFDFVEWQIGTDAKKVDTDGDGVPDGKEFMEDKTKPDDAKDYLVYAPVKNTTSFDLTKAVTITGTVPKPLQKDPSDESKLLDITNQDAGDAVVKLQGYDEASNSYTQEEYGTAKIPFAGLINGDFTIDIPANTVPEGKKVVLVAYSPNGENPAMGTPFEFTQNDAEKYEATGGTLDKAYGETATADEIIGKVTTTAPDDKVKTKEVVGTIPATGRDQKVKVKVTYADDSFDEVEVTLNYGTAAEKYAPVGQEVTVGKGGTPEASEGIKNKTDLPAGTTYEWKQPVDTTNPGTQKGTIVVTYPDQTTDEVEVDVQIKDAKTDAQLYEATGGTLNKAYGETATADEIIGKVTTTAPDDKVKTKEVVGTIPATGRDQKVKIKVTYADDSFDEVEVTLNYETAADKYEPEVEKEIVKPGGTVDLTDNVTNLDELPTGTKVKDVTENPIDTSKPGDHIGKVEVTYPDGSKEIIEVPVTVVDKTDAERYKPKTKREVIEEGQTYDLTDNVKNIDNLPAGTVVEDVTPKGDIDSDTPGNYTGTIKVIYPDGSSETVAVKVTIKKRKPDAEKYDPEVVPEIIYVGESADLTDNVANLEDELPEGTIVTDLTEYGEDGVNLDRPGKYKGKIEIEYPDGSTKELTVPIRVLKDGAEPGKPGQATPSEPDKATDSEAEKNDASKYKPKPNPIIIDQGETFEPEDGIKNKDELPEDTEYSDATPDSVDTSKNYTAIIIVTYPDGSKDKVKVPVTVRPKKATPDEAEETDANKYEPKPNPIVIDKGETFKPEDAIKNKDELPDGTEYRDETPGDVDKTKDYTAIIVVTYPDGSEDKVRVPVTVKPESSKPSKPNGSGNGNSGGSSGGGSGSKGSNASNDRIYANPDMNVTTGSIRGTWTLVDETTHKWTYTTSSGVMAKNGWMFIGNPYAKNEEGRFSWFKFDANGIMEFGWIKSQNGKWYHTHAVSDGNLGILHKGWYHEPMDGKWYYLDETTGAMRDGWVSLSGKNYYFTEASLVPEQTYFQKENGYWYYDNHNKRPYGSMYQNEMTPDNHFVDHNGVWDGKKH